LYLNPAPSFQPREGDIIFGENIIYCRRWYFTREDKGEENMKEIKFKIKGK
jgi:hypothetical protein